MHIRALCNVGVFAKSRRRDTISINYKSMPLFAHSPSYLLLSFMCILFNCIFIRIANSSSLPNCRFHRMLSYTCSHIRCYLDPVLIYLYPLYPNTLNSDVSRHPHDLHIHLFVVTQIYQKQTHGQSVQFCGSKIRTQVGDAQAVRLARGPSADTQNKNFR